MMLAQEIALKLGLSPRTLLDYQHKGIINPRRDRHGRWLYTDEHITAIRSHMAQRRHIFDLVQEPCRARGC